MRWAVRALLVVVPLLSLLLLARLAADWMAVAEVTGEIPVATAPRGFDWVQWEDQEGEIVAAYVYPGGTAHAAGLREGAVLFQLEHQQFFSADDVKSVVEGVPPGRELTYDVLEEVGSSRTEARYEILVTRYPTFLYPLAGTLWQLSLWGFALAAFLHVLALVIVAPLAGRTRRARRTTSLFAAASFWVVGNFLRLLAVTLFGPPMDGVYAVLFRALTAVALAGWVLFPALLLYTVVRDLPGVGERIRGWCVGSFVPVVVLGGAILATALWDAVGPITVDQLIAPILFYVCCYVAAASALSLWAGAQRPAAEATSDADVPAPTAWSRAGSALILGVAVLGALLVEGAVPLPGTISDVEVGGLILLIQLLSLAPVGLVSLATLRYGRADTVLSGGLAYLAVLGGVFFLLFAGLLVIERVFGAADAWTHALAASLYVMGILVLVERVNALVRRGAVPWLRTERQRARQRLRDFGERLRFILDVQRLAEATVEAVGSALRVRSVVLFLRDPATPEGAPAQWVRASYHPEPPFFTEGELERVWARLQAGDAVWARNAELDESALPPEDDRLLRQYGAGLAVPVAGGEMEPAGLLVLGRKERRRAVYNLEDVGQLRALAAQLALATERLALIEREKTLVRQTAEAHLVALRAQINPHFLFNALNTIAALIAEDPAGAEHAVERLARLFRQVLRTEGETFVPLREELRLVEDYLHIEQVRFGDRLVVEHDWDPALLEVDVPAFALQTLVENAVKHGIERQRGPGTLRLGGYLDREAGLAVLSVEDTGVGLPPLLDVQGDGIPSETREVASEPRPIHPPPAFFGIGLRNVADRLEHLYGRQDLLRFASTPGVGTTVELHLPLAHAAPEPERSR